MRAFLVALLTAAPMACAAKSGPCPAVASPAPSASVAPKPPTLYPVLAGTRTAAHAKLVPTAIAHQQSFIGCDIWYAGARPGSSIFLRWHVYATIEDYDAHKDVQHTDGKSQTVKGSGVINAYLQALDGTFESGIYECDFSLVEDGETLHRQRGTIWLDPPATPANKL